VMFNNSGQQKAFSIETACNCQGTRYNEIHKWSLAATLDTNSLCKSSLETYFRDIEEMNIDMSSPCSWCMHEIADKSPWQYYEDNMRIALWMLLKICQFPTWFILYCGSIVLVMEWSEEEDSN
jgi:hypothetical protein